MVIDNSGFEKEGIAKATVGDGIIMTGSDISGLNREADQSMLVTKNERVGGLLIDQLTVENKDIIATGKGVNPYMMYKFGYQATHDANGNELPIHEQERLQTHEKAAEEWGRYVENPYIAGTVRFFGEVGQFFYYSADDLTRLVITGEHGNYQPYMPSREHGGLLDSIDDINNVMNGANGNYQFYNPNEKK